MSVHRCAHKGGVGEGLPTVMKISSSFVGVVLFFYLFIFFLGGGCFVFVRPVSNRNGD